MTAVALHHVGTLEVTFVSLPASLPWIKIRDTINVSQELRAKMVPGAIYNPVTLVASHLRGLYIFDIIC